MIRSMSPCPLDIGVKYEVKNVIVCGKKSAYIHENAGEDEYLHASKYYYVLKRVPHFENIDDDSSSFIPHCFWRSLIPLAL